MESRKIIQIEDKVPFRLLVPLSIQHMFAMFGASVLDAVPVWNQPGHRAVHEWRGNVAVHLDHEGKGAGLPGFQFCLSCASGNRYQRDGISVRAGRICRRGILRLLLALIIYKFGSDWIDVVLPPAAMGPVVALIGLELSGSAASKRGTAGEDGRSKRT